MADMCIILSSRTAIGHKGPISRRLLWTWRIALVLRTPLPPVIIRSMDPLPGIKGRIWNPHFRRRTRTHRIIPRGKNSACEPLRILHTIALSLRGAIPPHLHSWPMGVLRPLLLFQATTV